MRRFLREKEQLNVQCRRDDTAKYNFPGWWLDYMRQAYPKHWHNIVTAANGHPPLTLRINRRHGNAECYLEKLAAEGIAGKALDEYAVILDEAVPVSRLPGFQTASYPYKTSAHSRRHIF